MKKLFLFVLTAMMICSCSESDTDDGSASVRGIYLSISDLTFESKGGTEAIWLYYDYIGTLPDTQWKLTGGDSWCTPSKTSGGNEDQIVFKVAENNDPDERNTTFTFTCGIVTTKLVVTQKQKGALIVTSSKIEMDATGGVADIEVKANIKFEYEIDRECKDWITYKETRAMQAATLAFDIAPNTSMEKREGTIIISSGELSETITIIQAGETPMIAVTQNKYDVSGDGETIEIEIKSNVEFEITKLTVNWIEESKTRTITSDKKYFTIYANSTTQPRTGEIEFANAVHNLSTKVTINQAAVSYTTVHVSQKGTLESELVNKGLDNNSLVSLKVTGELNDEDFLFVGTMQGLKNLDISEINLAVLPNKCFAENKNIQNIILPKTLTEIGGRMFLNCIKLKEIIIPQKVISIGELAFQGTAITNIVIPSSVKSIGRQAFYSLGLNSLTFAPNSNLEKIDKSAFSASLLPDITIPASVEIIEESAFQWCRHLTNVRFETNSKLTTIKRYAFKESAITSIEIPASVEYIDYAAFKQCQSLTTVTFAKNSRLQTIAGKYDGGVNGDIDNDEWQSQGAFTLCSSLLTIQIPASVTEIGLAAFKGCTSLETVTFEKGSQLKKIAGAYYFPWNYNLESYRNNYYGVFANCTALTTITIPASVETIELAAFQGCSSLQSVKFESNSLLSVIGGRTTTVGNGYGKTFYYGAFKGCPIKTFDATGCNQLSTVEKNAFDYNTISLFKLGTVNPPTCGCNFAATGNSVLKVPAEGVAAYQQAAGWKEFANISALD